MQEINWTFIELVQTKGYSMFHLIPDDEYTEGLPLLQQDQENMRTKVKKSGETLIWFTKN